MAEYTTKLKAFENGTGPRPKIAEIGYQYNIPKATFWMRATGRVQGTGVLAGGGKKPRVMTTRK